MKKGIKIVLCVLLALIVAFGAVSLAWYLTAYRAYDTYVEALSEQYETEKVSAYGVYAVDEEGYSYYIKRPGFLSWTGNLSVSVPSRKLSNGETLLYVDSLIIWPAKDGCEIGALLYTYEKDDTGILSTGHQFYISNRGAYIPQNDDSDAEKRQILEERRTSVTIMLEKCFAIWPEFNP